MKHIFTPANLTKEFYVRLSFKRMLKFAFISFSIFQVNVGYSQQKDTVEIKPADLKSGNLRSGNITYVVYTKKSKDAPSEGIYLAKVKIEKIVYDHKPAVSISQQWDKDEVTHTAKTILSENGLATLFHETYWKRTGYTAIYDFNARQVDFNGVIPDSVKKIIVRDFNTSFENFNLNWHSDLIVFSALPYKEDVVFKINFYDPGFGAAKPVYYAVTGSEYLMNSAGEKTSCWVLVHDNVSRGKVIGSQKFWISKKSRQVLKQEGLTNGAYRYKLKLDVSEN